MQSLERLKITIQKIMEKNDSAHDFEHIMRVYKNAQKIGKKENVNMKLVLAAVLLHDIISFPKSDKKSKTSSIKSAIVAQKILQNHGYDKDEIKIISDAIRDHSFSRDMIPSTIEGKILQDADRLDAIGAIGIARVFSVGGSEKRPFYNKSDPFCQRRKPDDSNCTLDHFYKKLLLLEKKMNTNEAKKEAKRRTKIMKKFLDDFKKEI
ncbi:MAG TPA: HD domain-containing protein [Nitrosopumilaceae archaeon]|nr:HD domain-containing protein [Nitrosopumilaceae archaeon]